MFSSYPLFEKYGGFLSKQLLQIVFKFVFDHQNTFGKWKGPTSCSYAKPDFISSELRKRKENVTFCGKG